MGQQRGALKGNAPRGSRNMFRKPWRQLAFVLGEAVLSLASSGFMFIIVSKASGPELLGAYALALAWLTLFQGLSSFGIPVFLIREVGSSGRDAGKQAVLAMLLGLASGLAALCLMLLAVRTMGYPADLVEVISIASLGLIPSFLGTACRAVFVAMREMHLTFLALLVEVAIVMSASLYLLLSGYGAIALMIVLISAKATSAIVALALLHRRVLPLRLSFDPDLLRRTARAVFTFGISQMLGMLTMRVGTILVSLLVDIAAVGQFAAATKIMEVGLILPHLLSQLLLARIAEAFNAPGNRHPDRFGASFQTVFAFVVPVCVGGWVFAASILESLFGAGFGSAAWVLRILMIYLAIETIDSLMSAILLAAHRQREDTMRHAFNPLVNVMLTLVLLPVAGTIGAAIGRAGGVAVSAVLRHHFIARELGAVRWICFALKPALVSIAAGSVSYALQDVGHPAWSALLYVALIGVLLIASSSISLAALENMTRNPASRT